MGCYLHHHSYNTKHHCIITTTNIISIIIMITINITFWQRKHLSSAGPAPFPFKSSNSPFSSASRKNFRTWPKKCFFRYLIFLNAQCMANAIFAEIDIFIHCPPFWKSSHVDACVWSLSCLDWSLVQHFLPDGDIIRPRIAWGGSFAETSEKTEWRFWKLTSSPSKPGCVRGLDALGTDIVNILENSHGSSLLYIQNLFYIRPTLFQWSPWLLERGGWTQGGRW